MTSFAARCHCGSLSFTFETGKSPEELGARACACSFCRRHRARTTSDPDGVVTFRFDDETKLNRYRFGLRMADFLVCRDCGAYLAAVYSEEGNSWATLNVNAFETPDGFPEDPPAVFYEGESGPARAERRKARWTPVVGYPRP